MFLSHSQKRRFDWAIVGIVVLVMGCGTMKSQVATEQLLISDAIERSADQFDFSSLSGTTVYLDTQYMSKVTAQGFLNSDYIRSALRQRLMRANCRLAEAVADAEYVVEVRVGALGTDSHEVNYGIPANQPITSTAAIFTGSAGIPALPEVSLAKKNERRGAAKLHLFAYNRETMEPVWQPDVSHGKSSARSTWVLGAGPFEKGTIYDRTRFAGATLDELEVNHLAIHNLKTGVIGNVLGNSLSLGSNILAGLVPISEENLANPIPADESTTPIDDSMLESAMDQLNQLSIAEEADVPAFAIPVAMAENAQPIRPVSHSEEIAETTEQQKSTSADTATAIED